MYNRNELVNGYTFQFGFQEKFDALDEANDPKGVKNLFKSITNEHKDIKSLTELACVLNLRCWYHYREGNHTLSALYGDLFYKTQNIVYSGKYSDEELTYFFRVTD